MPLRVNTLGPAMTSAPPLTESAMVVGEVTLIVDGPVIATGLGVVSPWAARVPPASVTLPLMFTALARVWPLALRVPPLRVRGPTPSGPLTNVPLLTVLLAATCSVPEASLAPPL